MTDNQKVRKNPIQVRPAVNNDPYTVWGEDKSQARAFKDYGDGLVKQDMYTSRAYRYTDFSNLLPGISARPGFTQDDYDYFRPDAIIPQDYNKMIARIERTYQKSGIIRNIIDLMGDFTSQGIRISHPNKGKEKILRQWFNKVRGPHVTERICNLLYRHGVFYIQIYTAKIKANDMKSWATADFQKIPTIEKLDGKEMPCQYIFLSPQVVEPIAESIVNFTPFKRYGIKLSEDMRNTIKRPKSQAEKELVDALPQSIKEAANYGYNSYPIDPAKLYVDHYKKDDWMPNGNPIIYSILDDVDMLEQLKLADRCALDGVISKVRIFKVGSLEHKVNPNPAVMQKLSDILANNVGGGAIDIVWGPDIEILETDGNTFDVLGEEKFRNCLNNIYSATGIPPSLTGTFGSSGTTNNFISLKTLTERLEYGRNIVINFWRTQLKSVCDALGIKQQAEIEFDKPILANEDAQNSLLKDLVDRGVLSDELVRRRLGANDKMETVRLNREDKSRKSGKRVKKAGPFFDPHVEDDMKKIALTSGVAAPSEVGLNLDKKKPGEKRRIDIEQETKMKQSSQSPTTKKIPGQPGQGRPKGVKDKTKRKARTVRPRTKASLALWARQTQSRIADILNPVLLEMYGKNNIRSLTKDQYTEAENIKFSVLSNVEPFSEVSEESVNAALNNGEPSNYAFSLLKEDKDSFLSLMNREPTVDEIREMQCYVYADIYNEDE